jgi:HSP20 family protein
MTLVEWRKPSVNGNLSKAVFSNQPFSGLLDSVFAKEYQAFVPAVNISEEEKGYRLELSAPGYNKEDFKIVIEKGTLIISGKHNEEQEVKEKTYSRKEFNYGSFQRTFTLPEQVNDNEITAKYENGILYLLIPKREEDKSIGKEIKVN